MNPHVLEVIGPGWFLHEREGGEGRAEMAQEVSQDLKFGFRV